MPIHRGKDSKGYFYQWGYRKKYYYIPKNIRSRLLALNKAKRQARAIIISQFRKLRRF